MPKIDLNCDMGEGFGPWRMGDDSAMLAIATSANIACGFHAGDPAIMHRTIAEAKRRGVGVGAHPGFLDLWGFGRRPMPNETPETVEQIVRYQIGGLQAIARSLGHPLRHVKTHGSLGNLAAVSRDHAMAVGRAIRSVDPALIFVVLPNTETERAGRRVGLPLASEIYADRAYDDSGNLVPRGQPGAVIEDPEEAVKRTLAMLSAGGIISQSGTRIPARIDSVGVHGDSETAVATAGKLREALQAQGFELAPLDQIVVR